MALNNPEIEKEFPNFWNFDMKQKLE